MLKLHEFNETDFSGGCVALLDKAENVFIEESINDISSLYFDYPAVDEKIKLIKENMIVSCEGQGYVILKCIRRGGDKEVLQVTAADLFSSLGRKKYIPNIPDMIGVKPSSVFKKALSDSDFTAFTEAELNKRGLTWFDSDGYKIDFFSTDKTDLWDISKIIIDNSGRGEIYRDNFKVAIVKRLGSDNGVRLSLEKNLENLQITKDMESVVTRLYPYGADDMHIGSVNNERQYIDSPNISKYGIKEGYKDYSDYTDPSKIKAHAEWEFSEDNENRIDIPKISISGKIVDLSKLAAYGELEKIGVGDTVHIYDSDGNVYNERIVMIKRYLYEAQETTVNIGHIQTDEFNCLWQTMQKTRGYDKSQTTNKQIAARSLSGVLNSDRNNVKSENERFAIEGDLLSIKDSDGEVRIQIGNLGGEFVFIIYDKNSDEAVLLNERGEAVLKGSIQTSKDCIIQGALRVGMGGAGSKGIEFYGDSYSDDSECYAKMLPWADSNDDKITGINITDGRLLIGGNRVAVENELTALESRIKIWANSTFAFKESGI